MLSRFLLSFEDQDLKEIYSREKVEFFSKAMPVISLLLFLLATTLEVAYRGVKIGSLPLYISIVNWVFFGIFIMITCLHSYCVTLHALVCPCLTTLTFLYLSFLDYDYTLGSIYYSLIIGFTISYFILVVFNEMWLISTLVFAPCLTFYMYRTGFDLLGSEVTELAVRSAFCVIIYAIIAYRIEILTK